MKRKRLNNRDFADLRDLSAMHEELSNYGEKYDHYENKYCYEGLNDGFFYKMPTTLEGAIKRRTFAKRKSSKKKTTASKPKKKGRVVRASTRQTGTSSKVDESRKAMSPGKRKSSKKKKGRVVRASTRQTGTSSKVDKSRKAMSPGKRKSSSGRTYYEYRKNRTDVRGRKT